MISFKVNGNTVATYPNQTVGIEKSSPLLNDSADGFSYPFAVPRIPNKIVLGDPGNLRRSNVLENSNFELRDKNILVVSGKLGYDSITKNDVGLYLQSDNTVFAKNVENKVLSDFDLGSESWFKQNDLFPEAKKFKEWENATKNFENDKKIEYVLPPFRLKNRKVNSWKNGDSIGLPESLFSSYCLCWSAGYLLSRLLRAAGYNVITNEIIDSPWRNVIVFGKIMNIPFHPHLIGEFDPESGFDYDYVFEGYEADELDYNLTVPDWDVNDFVDTIKKLMCVSIEFDEIYKTVSIYFKKRLFDNPTCYDLNNETIDYSHKEFEDCDGNGFNICYGSQKDSDATKFCDIVKEVNSLPTPAKEIEGMVYKVIHTKRIYKCVLEDENYKWKRICRLSPFVKNGGENKVKIDVNVPGNIIPGKKWSEMPYIDCTLSGNGYFVDMDIKAVSMYRGIVTSNNILAPLATFDSFLLEDDKETGNVLSFKESLLPENLYKNLYKNFIEWQTYRLREVTKYVKMTLLEVISLRWDVQYIIDGIVIFINKIKIDLPYKGIVEIQGYTYSVLS